MARKPTDPAQSREPSKRKRPAVSTDAQASKPKTATATGVDARSNQPGPTPRNPGNEADAAKGSREERANTERGSGDQGDVRRISGKPLPLSDYVAILRREIARAGAMTAPDDDLPVVSLAEAELSFSYVVVAIEGEQIYIDPSSGALASAPAAAVQRMRLRMVDTEIALALHEKI